MAWTGTSLFLPLQKPVKSTQIYGIMSIFALKNDNIQQSGEVKPRRRIQDEIE
jgi:hypothetical protein